MAKAPVFQHRHYKAVAARLNRARDTVGSGQPSAGIVKYVTDEMADMFADDNPRFDRARFLAAASGKPSNGRDKV